MKYVYRLENLGCASCAEKMERAVNKIDGVSSARIIFMTAKLTMDADDSKIEAVEREARKAIRKIEPDVKMKRA